MYSDERLEINLNSKYEFVKAENAEITKDIDGD